ncbi:phosphoribosylformylglycinamidine cyclo-ligase [Candidatus Woesearchaeota archaeon]|nr:phosphoribosylformylglycinamidine cyclo-ligase [Candidatus Woesearchaeota archaeon]
MKEKKFTYKKAGVDIDAADKNQKLIKHMIKETYSKNVLHDKEGLGAMYQIPSGYKNPVLVSGTDGVGTKLKIAFLMDKHDTIGIDLVAMCANDIIRRGAKPLFFMDYIATGKLKQHVVREIIKGIIKGCRQAQCSLIGGETAQMPDFYKKDEYDLSGFCTGIAEKQNIISGKKIKTGDKIIGLESTGIHSNGFSLVRKVLLSEHNIDEEIFNSKKLGEILLTPTRIYVKPILEILDEHPEVISGLVHMTGSAYNKLLRMNPEVGYKIKKLLKIPKIFDVIQKYGSISGKEMFSTFNMGIGFMIIARNSDFLEGFEEKYGYKAEVIGVVDDSKKVRIFEKEIELI